jgi:sulfur carrier protein
MFDKFSGVEEGFGARGRFSLLYFAENGMVIMKLMVNGESRETSAAMVLALLEELGLNPAATVVERNHELVDRAAYGETPLAAGDVLELVRIVGGG